MSFDPAEVAEMFAELSERDVTGRELFGGDFSRTPSRSGYSMRRGPAPRAMRPPDRHQLRFAATQSARVTDPCERTYGDDCPGPRDEMDSLATSCGGRVEVARCPFCGATRYQGVTHDGLRSPIIKALATASAWMRDAGGGVLVPIRPPGVGTREWAMRLLYDCLAMHRKLMAYTDEARRLYRLTMGDDAPPCDLPDRERPRHVSEARQRQRERMAAGPSVVRRRAA